MKVLYINVCLLSWVKGACITCIDVYLLQGAAVCCFVGYYYYYSTLKCFVDCSFFIEHCTLLQAACFTRHTVYCKLHTSPFCPLPTCSIGGLTAKHDSTDSSTVITYLRNSRRVSKKSAYLLCQFEQYFIVCKKNPAYGIQRISQLMRIVAPISKISC